MMKDIKQCLKLLKYGYQMKTNMVCACLFVALGIFFMVINHGQFIIGTMYIYIAIMFVTQTMYIMMFSECVAASSRRETIELRYVDILNAIGGVLGSLLIISLAYLTPQEDLDGASIESMLVISGIMAWVLYCYMSMSFKSMIVSTLLFFVSFCVLMGSIQTMISEVLTNVLGGKPVLAVVIFLLENVLGIVCAHGIRKLLYRKNMSKLAAGAKLRMEQS